MNDSLHFGARLMICIVLFSCGPSCRKSEQQTADTPSSTNSSGQTEDRSAAADEGLDDFLASSPQAKPADGQLPPGHPPLNGVPATPTPADTTAALKYDVPADWQPEPPKSRMRKAQFVLPGVDGANGQMIVFYFGPGQGGPTQMNIDRWIAMFKKADGTPVGQDGASVEKKTINNNTVTLLDISGIYQDAMSGQSTPTTVDYRLYAAVVELPVGEKWFFKAVGPASTMASHRAGFDQLLESLK